MARDERLFAAGFVVAMTGVIGWVLWVCLVVDVREVIGVEPAALQEAWRTEPALAVIGWVQLVITWLLPVAAVAGSALLAGHLGWRYWSPRSRTVAWGARLVPALGALGFVAAVSAVVWPGWGFALGAYTAAEELGVALPTGTIGPTRLATGAAGAAVALASLVGGVALSVAWSLDRRRRGVTGSRTGVTA